MDRFSTGHQGPAASGPARSHRPASEMILLDPQGDGFGAK